MGLGLGVSNSGQEVLDKRIEMDPELVEDIGLGPGVLLGEDSGSLGRSGSSLGVQGELLWALPEGLLDVPLVSNQNEKSSSSVEEIFKPVQVVPIGSQDVVGPRSGAKRGRKPGPKSKKVANNLVLKPCMVLAKKSRGAIAKRKRKEKLKTGIKIGVESDNSDNFSSSGPLKERAISKVACTNKKPAEEEVDEIVEVSQNLEISFVDDLEVIKARFAEIESSEGLEI